MKRILIFCMFLFTPITTHANEAKTILIYSKDLQQIFIMKVTDSSQINLMTLETSTYIKPACATNTLASIDSLLSSRECLLDSLENNFVISINNFIELNLKAIDEDYTLSYNRLTLQTFNDVQLYFEELGESINYSVLWRFNNYMNTNLDLKEILDFYNIYSSNTLTITYYYPFLIQINKHWIPLDKSFYVYSQ